MPEALSPIPPKRPEDPEEVALELTLAANSWNSGDQQEALAALRRAASVAYRLHAGRRVSELAKAVAELSKTMMAGAPSTSQKAGPPMSSAAMRASTPSVPKPPPMPVADVADPDDIPISLDDVEVVDDPFPSIPPAGAQPPPSGTTPAAKKAPALATKKEPAPAAAPAPAPAPTPAAAAPAERASRASSRPGKGRRSTPPKSKETEKSGSLVVAAPVATTETSGVLDVAIKDVTPPAEKEPAKDAPTNGAASADPNHGDRQTSPGDLPSNPALQHRPTPVGEDHAVAPPMPTASTPPPTKSFADPPTPTPPGATAKNAASKTQLPVDPPMIADLANIVTLASLDAAARAKVIGAAKAISLAKGERVAAPSVVIVVRGEVDVRPKERGIAVDRVPAGEARTLEAEPPCVSGELVLVAGDAGARCLALPRGALDFLRESSVDVHKALQRRADELCAFAAVLRERPIGSLADGLLLELRRRSEVRRLDEGTIIVRASEAVRALVVVASGALTLHATEGGPEVGRIRPGEVLFPRELVGSSASPREARVAQGGALVLAARKGPTVTLLGEHAHLRKALETWGADDPFQEW